MLVKRDIADSAFRSFHYLFRLRAFIKSQELFNTDFDKPTFRNRSLSLAPRVLTPWHLKLLAFILTGLLPMLKLLVASNRILGLLDQAFYLLVLIHLPTDPFWSLWIIPLYNHWHIRVNVIMQCLALWRTTTFDALLLENWKLYSPGPVCSLLMKPMQYNLLTYDHSWRPDFAPNGIFKWSLRTWSFVTPTSPEMFFKFVKIGLSCSSWTSTDLIGELDNIIIWNPLYWFRVLNNPLFFGWPVTRYDRASFSHRSMFIGSFVSKKKLCWLSFFPFWSGWNSLRFLFYSVVTPALMVNYVLPWSIIYVFVLVEFLFIR